MALMGSKTVDVKAFFDKELANDIVEKAALKGLRRLGENILGQAIDYCPRDNGALAESGTVRKSEKDKTVTISFNTPYALRLHEGVDFNFSKAKNPKAQAKYLERAFNEKQKQASWFVEKEIGDTLYKEKGKQWGY